VRRGSGIISVLTDSDTFQSAECGPGKPLVKLASIIAHEASHVRNGPSERLAYEAQLQRLRAGGSTSRLKPGPEVVHAALRHALLSRRPRPHYVVTVPARIGVVLKRILPASMLYRLLAKRA